MASEHPKAGQSLTNRELSWLQFNARVLAEADNPDNPLLERAKFLSIVTSNLDEFLQVRYGRILEATKACAPQKKKGLSAQGLRRRVNKEILHQLNLQYLLYEGIRSELYLQGVWLYPIFTPDESMRKREAELFQSELLPELREQSSLVVVKQKQLYLCAKVTPIHGDGVRFAMVPIPAQWARLRILAQETDRTMVIRAEEIVRRHVEALFPKERVEHAAFFRVLRNQHFPVMESTREDVVAGVREMLRKRETGAYVRLEAEEGMSEEMLNFLTRRFALEREQRYRVTGPLDLNRLLMGLYGMLPKEELKYPAAIPCREEALLGDEIFAQIACKDWLLYHPYHSFEPVVRLFKTAAQDPCVRTVKVTLYRVSGQSPIVEALVEAARNGKRVMVFFEAHARFDEHNNLKHGKRLEAADCQVLYGLPGLKVHSKIALIEREEEGNLKRYLHLGTGNYHDRTARLYTDFGLLTAEESLCADADEFFQGLEGYPSEPLQELAQAPDGLRPKLLSLIERERCCACEGRPSGILAKMNSLSDMQIIAALYDASRAGVPIRLIVRGICCLTPGVAGMSENIEVISIVGRHLEHARAFRFENGGTAEVYLSSADWMPRNLGRRVELMFPVKDERCKAAVERVLRLQWSDECKASRKRSDGMYARRCEPGAGTLNAQELLLAHLEDILEGEPAETPCASLELIGPKL